VRRLPWPLVQGLLVVGLLRHGLGAVPMTLASAVVAAAPLWLLLRLGPSGRPRWHMGGGDLRLAFALGAWLGALPALFVLALAGAAAGLAGLVARHASQPFGAWCALAAAGLVVLG